MATNDIHIVDALEQRVFLIITVNGLVQALEQVGDGYCAKMLNHLAGYRDRLEKLPLDTLRPGYSRFELKEPCTSVAEFGVVFNLMSDSDLEELCDYLMNLYERTEDPETSLRVCLYGFF